MVTPGPAGEKVRRSRPRDRKQQILAAAAQSLSAVSFHQLSMADIAAGVDIRASALYRHYKGKQDLLWAVLDDGLSQLESILAQCSSTDAMLDAVAPFALRRREFGLVWTRDIRELPAADREGLEARAAVLTEHVHALLSSGGDGVEPGKCRVADRTFSRVHTDALIAAMLSPSRHRSEVAPGEFTRFVRDAAVHLTTTDLPSHASAAPAAPAAPKRPLRLPVNRREAILAAATMLFEQHGYASVGLADIGAVAGITGPTISHHFGSKAELLDAALVRGNEALWLSLHHAIGAAGDTADALDRLAESYAAFVRDNRSTIAILETEIANAPAERQAVYREGQHAYLQEWVALLGQIHPSSSPPSLRFRLHAAIAVINRAVRQPAAVDSAAYVRDSTMLAKELLRMPLTAGRAEGNGPGTGTR